MSPPLVGVDEEPRGNASAITGSSTMDCISQNSSGLKEPNYLGLSDCSSDASSRVLCVSEDNKSNLNLKATKLRLGLPGSLSSGRDPDPNEPILGKFEEKSLLPLLP